MGRSRLSTSSEGFAGDNETLIAMQLRPRDRTAGAILALPNLLNEANGGGNEQIIDGYAVATSLAVREAPRDSGGKHVEAIASWRRASAGDAPRTTRRMQTWV